MENPNTKNISVTSSNYFFDWITSNYLPNCIVYSSQNAKNIILKNNLTPSEFLRPFGNFSGTNINFSCSDKFTINLKNLKLDFYDSENFSKFSFNSISEITENLLTTGNNYPEWNLNILLAANISKFNCDPIFRRLKNFSFPWFNEYEKLYFESLYFNEFEIYQQPFANIYIISIKDDKREIENFMNKENVPLLIEEGIYEKGIPSMILILNDKSHYDSTSNDTLFKVIDEFKKSFPKFYVLCSEINSNSIDSGEHMKDIWSNHFHKLDIYKSGNEHYKDVQTKYGEYISFEERENFKSGILKFFNEFIKIYLQKLVLELDDEITNNKKGIKNGFLSIFKKTEKIEFVNVFNIYKLTLMEKKLYLLSLIQFYFRDYDNCIEHLKILMNDIKSKSVEHYNSICEMYTICHFICAVGLKKEVDLEAPYNNYLKSKNTRFAFKYLLLQIKMMEHLKRFNEIPKLLIKANSELIMPFMSPLLLEKASIYYLLGNNSSMKKFVFYQILSGIAFKNSNAELKRYTLNCFGNIFKYFSKNSQSFLRSKEYLNSNMGDISMNLEYFEAGLKFYKNCIELSTFKNLDQDQALYIRHFLKTLNSIGVGSNMSYVEIDDLKIPEIINSSLLVIEEQDYEIGVYRTGENSIDQVTNTFINPANASTPKNINWGNFFKYSRVDINKLYINLSENDVMILKNLDNIVENKQNLSNLRSKRIFKGNVNNKIYVRFMIRNQLNLNLSMSSLKLICDFVPDKQSQQETQINFIETEEKTLLLEKNTSCIVTLSCIPRSPGRVIIQGLEIGLYKIALFKHSFYKRDLSDLFSYRDKNYSNLNPKIKDENKIEKGSDKKEICFDIINNNQDINLILPLGKEIDIYYNEFLCMPLIIKNNTNLKIKRFCLFFDDSNVLLNKNSSLKMENNICLTNIIFKEINLAKDNQYEVLIPICPKVVGERYLKILVKFEEESKLREIDIKRYLVKFNIKPSVCFNINEELLYFDSNSTSFNLDVNTFIDNREDLSFLNIDQIYFNNNFRIIFNKDSDWKQIENENYYKLYSKLRFTKEIKNSISQNNQSVKDLESSFTSISTSAPEKFEFLSDDVIRNQTHLISSLNELLNTDRIFFQWTAELGERRITGIYIYECKLKIPAINKNFLKTVFKNSTMIEINQISNIVEEKSLVLINLKINKKNLLEIQEISAYEFFISDEDNDFIWMGLNKFKIFNTAGEDSEINLNFKFLTAKKGTIEVNKFNVMIFPKNVNEKSFTIQNVPNNLIFEVK